MSADDMLLGETDGTYDQPLRFRLRRFICDHTGRHWWSYRYRTQSGWHTWCRCRTLPAWRALGR